MSFGRGLVVGSMSLVIFVGLLQLLAMYGRSWYSVELAKNRLSHVLSYEVTIGLRSVQKQICSPVECWREGQSLDSMRATSREWAGFDDAGKATFAVMWLSFVTLVAWFILGLARLLMHPLTVERTKYHVAFGVGATFGLTVLALALYASRAPGFAYPVADPYLTAGLAPPPPPPPSMAPGPSPSASPPPPPGGSGPGGGDRPLNFKDFTQAYGDQFSVALACMVLQTLAGLFLVVPFFQNDELEDLQRAFLVEQPNGDVLAAVSPLLRDHLHVQCPQCHTQMAGPASTVVACPTCAAPIRVPADVELVDMFEAYPPGHPLALAPPSHPECLSSGRLALAASPH
ncbi:uncharacterized protein AMSG_05214 [Thecamonas trahens ATCC 50062]|uniref:Uncharacterized protein n=1 Tax=Thecamonas trahens ATCC 50062 TaxID=461836 RepID=A0A0L0DAW3_THETB|nr:hypothetical protein AMSG_05214 [Thecamonas trahens ATCC 50062]KNC49226.1 hypothetical protein AMSG_05214 [Thecamonas trahens ATCC 50062]|eukprot:XP_013757945.1 hypothetical protein AMSG_05214 [Thecamonas trahens ATCC 50062]